MVMPSNVLGLIGNTPMLKLEKITRGIDANVWVKLEFLNPSGSIKDRAAKYMVEQAEKRGELKTGSVIMDSTSGNFGPAISLVGAVKGYKVRLFVSKFFLRTQEKVPPRFAIMKSYGPEVGPCPDPPSELLKDLPERERALAFWASCKKNIVELRKNDPKIWWADQLTNPDHPIAYRQTIGKEILDQTPGQVDVWTASVGSGGTLWGVAEALREKNSTVKIVGLQPTDCPVMEWVKDGLWEKWTKKLDFVYPQTIVKKMQDAGLPDEIMEVRDEDARNMANRLCAEEGFFCGMSSGANVHAAIELAKKLKKGQNVVTVLVDRRDRYLSEYPNEHYVV